MARGSLVRGFYVSFMGKNPGTGDDTWPDALLVAAIDCFRNLHETEGRAPNCCIHAATAFPNPNTAPSLYTFAIFRGHINREGQTLSGRTRIISGNWDSMRTSTPHQLVP
jgi:hypothetical protein